MSNNHNDTPPTSKDHACALSDAKRWLADPDGYGTAQQNLARCYLDAHRCNEELCGGISRLPGLTRGQAIDNAVQACIDAGALQRALVAADVEPTAEGVRVLSETRRAAHNLIAAVDVADVCDTAGGVSEGIDALRKTLDVSLVTSEPEVDKQHALFVDDMLVSRTREGWRIIVGDIARMLGWEVEIAMAGSGVISEEQKR